MFCTNCGKQIPDEAAFCPYCRQPTERNGAVSGVASQTTQYTQTQVDVSMPTPVPSPQRESVPQKKHAGWTAVLIIVACVLGIGAGVVAADASGLIGDVLGIRTNTNVKGSMDATASAVEVDTDVSTPIGNLVNGGYVCEDDDSVYYAAPVTSASGWYTNGIVRASKTGSDRQVIYTNNADGTVIYHLNVESGRVIFTEVSGGSTTVRSVGTDGSDARTLANADDSSLLQVYKGRVYYLLGGTVKVMDPDGGNEEDVLSVGSRLWRIANDKVVSFDNDNIYISNLDGSDSHTLVSASQLAGQEGITNVIPRTDGSYEVLLGSSNEGGAYELYAISDTGAQVGFDGEATGGTHINRVNPTSDGTIALLDYTGTSTASEDMSAHEQVRVLDTGTTLYETDDADVDLCYPTYIDGYVYFGSIEQGNNRLMRVPMSGGSADTVA